MLSLPTYNYQPKIVVMGFITEIVIIYFVFSIYLFIYIAIRTCVLSGGDGGVSSSSLSKYYAFHTPAD